MRRVTAYGLGFEGHTWRGQNQQSWRWVHTIARPGQRSLVMAGHDSIFKREHVQLQQNALWIFDCRQGGSLNPRKAWSPTDLSQIISRMFSWMSGCLGGMWCCYFQRSTLMRPYCRDSHFQKGSMYTEQCGSFETTHKKRGRE